MNAVMHFIGLVLDPVCFWQVFLKLLSTVEVLDHEHEQFRLFRSKLRLRSEGIKIVELGGSPFHSV